MQKEGLSQKALSLKASLNETAVRDILKGRVKHPRMDTTMAIANALGVSVEYLIEEQTTEHYPSASKNDLVFLQGVVSNTQIQEKPYLNEASEEVVGLTPFRYKAKNVFAVSVEDFSANQLYPKGSKLSCVKLAEWDKPLKVGQRVLVWSSDNGDEGKLRVYELGAQSANGDIPLYAKSTLPEMRSEIITSKKSNAAVSLEEGERKWKEEPELDSAVVSYTLDAHDPHQIIAVIIAHTVEE